MQLTVNLACVVEIVISGVATVLITFCVSHSNVKCIVVYLVVCLVMHSYTVVRDVSSRTSPWPPKSLMTDAAVALASTTWCSGVGLGISNQVLHNNTDY